MRCLLIILCCLLFQHSLAQKTNISKTLSTKKNSKTDSILLKTVRGINKSLKDRFNSQLNIFTDYVIIDKEGHIPIDSLHKYNMKDFKQITITFDEPGAIYGPYASSVGIIRLVRKK